MHLQSISFSQIEWFAFSLQRREVEYDEYLKDRLVEAKNEFRALLRETKAITYRSYDMIKESDKHHKDIVDVLKVLCMCHIQ